MNHYVSVKANMYNTWHYRNMCSARWVLRQICRGLGEYDQIAIDLQYNGLRVTYQMLSSWRSFLYTTIHFAAKLNQDYSCAILY